MFERRIARPDLHFGDLRLVAHLKPPQVWKTLEVAKVLQITNLAERKIPEFRQRLDRTDRLAIPEDEFQRLQRPQPIDELERELRRGLNRQLGKRGGAADRFRVFANVDWRNADAPEWAAKAVANLELAVKNGAIGLKVAKNLGLGTTKTDGSRLHVDDPILKPVWEAAGRMNIPVIIHTAEPQEFFSPLDMKNERWLELALFEDRRNYRPEGPSFQDLQDELSEGELQSARRYYNATVRDLNTTVQIFPPVLIARPFGFNEEPFYQDEDPAIQSAPKVSFERPAA